MEGVDQAALQEHHVEGDCEVQVLGEEKGLTAKYRVEKALESQLKELAILEKFLLDQCRISDH